MAKKKKGRRRAGYSDGSDDGGDDSQTFSDAVSSSTFGAGGDDEDHVDSQAPTWQDELISAMDDLTERASAKRASGLQTILKYMARHYTGELLERYRDTLLSCVTTLFNRGTMAEQTQCAQVLSLYALSVHDIHENDVERTCNLLRAKIAEGASKSNVTSAAMRATERRVECVRALYIWLYVSDEWSELARDEGTMDALRDDLWSDHDSIVAAEAVHGWTLMASSLPENILNDVILPRYREQLEEMLRSGSMDVRTAAGEALALLYEAHIGVQETLPHAQRDFDPALDSVIDAMEDLADASGKHMSRKSRTVQKGFFRNYVNTLEGGSPPQEQVTVHKNRVGFEGWSQVIPFLHIRHILGSGIAEHFQNNDLVRQILQLEDEDFDPTRPRRKMTHVEKRRYLSKSSEASKQDTITKSKLTRISTNFIVTDTNW